MESKVIAQEKEILNFRDKKFLSMVVRGNIDDISQIKNKSFRKKVKTTSIWYTAVVVFFILISFVLLEFNIDQLAKYKYIFVIIEICTFLILLIDYLLRWYTADVQLGQGRLSFILFPFKFIPILLLISMVPTVYVVNIFLDDHTHRIWVILGVLKLTRIVRILMVASLFPSLKVIRRVIQRSKNWITIAFLSIIVTVLLFALAIDASELAYFDVNPKVNDHGMIQGYWSAVYYCVIALTTIGFGDIQVYSSLARVLTAIMAFIGIIIITIPFGILAGTFMSEVRDSRAEKAQQEIQHKYDSLLLKLDKVEQKEIKLTQELFYARKNINTSDKNNKTRTIKKQKTNLAKNKRV